jgi:CIC family chloride channel protein
MPRYGSERIRGHGIPEAIESILVNGNRIEPKMALLKPISSAISIGSVAGAAGGMSATFAAPVAAVLLAVELLLFEWKPRSFDTGCLGKHCRGIAWRKRDSLSG